MQGLQRPFALVLVFVIAAGCIQAEPESVPPGAEETTPAVAPPGEFDESTGAVTGTVVDSELKPISGADVGMVGPTELRARTAADGGFSFSHVPPGDYVVTAAAIGFTSDAKGITIESGSANDGVNLVLEAIAAKDARIDVYIFKGYITCTVGAFGVLSEECGQGLQTDLGTFGTNPNNKIDYKWNITDPSIQGLVMEMLWQPGSAAASQLTLYVSHGFKCTPSCDEPGDPYCGTDNHGPPIQRCVVSAFDIEEASVEQPWDMTSRAWGAPVDATEIPNIVLEQSFEMYRTDFWGQEVPEDYTAVPDQ